jgi:hypothetical protein
MTLPNDPQGETSNSEGYADDAADKGRYELTPEYSSEQYIDFIPNAGQSGESDAGEIVSNVVCRKCAYNLRGLPTEGRCPECGAPFGVSVLGALLCFNDPRWLDTLHRGATLTLIGAPVYVIAAIVVTIVDSLAAAGFGVSISINLLQLAGYMAMVSGAWFLTSPDPSGIDERADGFYRKLIRVTFVVGLIRELISVASSSEALRSSGGEWMILVWGAAALTALAGFIAELHYIGKLARRIPDPRMADRAKFLMTPLGGSIGGLLIWKMYGAMIWPVQEGARDLIGLGCMAFFVFPVLAVFYVRYLFLLGKFSAHMREQASVARQTWVASPTTAPPQ